MFRRRVTYVALLMMLVFVVVPVANAQDATPVDETLFLPFVPDVQFAPVYVALEQGYFTSGGINLTLEYGDENVGVDLIASNGRQFGLISGEEVIKARANDRPVVYVYEWFQKYPIGIVVSDASGIESVKGLTGHKVGIPGRFGASYDGLTALLNANGMKESDIDLQEIGFNAPDVFCVGGVDAAVVYINNEPLQIQERAAAGNCNGVKDIKVFPVSDAVDLVSNGVVTNEQTVSDKPELVQSMVTSFNNGLRDTINNPAEAYLLCAKYIDNLTMSDTFKAALEDADQAQVEFLKTDPSREAIAASRATLLDTLSAQFDSTTLVQFHVLLNTIDLWDAEALGFSDMASWEITEKTLTDMGFISTSIDLTKAFTNDFLPSAAG
jgi:putative riboflavin transport system substrate-binding protein